jgi:hypothetical protein
VGGACGGQFSFTFDSAYMASQGIGAGTTVYGQFWLYDLPPESVGLSDAIQFTVGP